MNIYLIYGVTDCPSCLRAQAILMDLDIEYVFIDMSFSKAYMKSIKKQFDWPTFPVIVEVSTLEIASGGTERDRGQSCLSP